MHSLKVLDTGILLEGSSDHDTTLPPQAFAITIPDNVIESIISGARNGEVRLSLGANPTLHYGSKSHRIAQPLDDKPHDIYMTKPFESVRIAQRLPNVSTVFRKPNPPALPQKKRSQARNEAASAKPSKESSSSKASTPPSLDSDLEALQNGLAAHDAAKERALVVDKLPASGKTKGKLLSSYGSLPASPALNASHSPTMNPTLSASDQAMGRAKEQRFTLVHELAVKDQPKEYLRKKFSGPSDAFDSTMDKVAVLDPETKRLAMRRVYWRELDVWKYPYDRQEDRQMAIDNAVRHFDKQRLSSSEPEWQKLLPVEERGKGKCLSRLQANIAKISAPAPKIKVQRADDSSGSKDDGDSLDSDKSKIGGESMSRSNSNPLPKAKKSSAQEAQAKRLLNHTKPKTAVQKPSPTKAKGATSGKSNGGRVLSQAIIENSDSSGDEIPMVKAKTAAKPLAKPKDTVIVNTNFTAKSQPRAPPAKRQREEDDDSSSSSATPLAKRMKPKQTLPPAQPKNRTYDANSRSSGSSGSIKNKNTSPTKSSPLASSPPTNASELENEGVPLAKKRKAEGNGRAGPTAKRRVAGYVSTEVMSQANKFKLYYNKYVELHEKLFKLAEPPREQVDYLRRMRGRLADMKADIYQRCPPSQA